MGFAIDDIRYTMYDVRSRSFGTIYDVRYDYLVYNFFKVGTWRLIFDLRYTMFDLRPRSFGAIYDLRCLLSGLYFFIFSLRYLLIAHAIDYLL